MDILVSLRTLYLGCISPNVLGKIGDKLGYKEPCKIQIKTLKEREDLDKDPSHGTIQKPTEARHQHFHAGDAQRVHYGQFAQPPSGR